jgi:phage/plasmid-associated DNA primase
MVALLRDVKTDKVTGIHRTHITSARHGEAERKALGELTGSAVKLWPLDYLEVEDAFGSWLEECCVQGPNETATSAELWDSWQRWAVKSNEFVGSQRRFAQKLEDRGFKRDRDWKGGKRVRIHRGLDVIM